jgi:hypothetical protein
MFLSIESTEKAIGHCSNKSEEDTVSIRVVQKLNARKYQ